VCMAHIMNRWYTHHVFTTHTCAPYTSNDRLWMHILINALVYVYIWRMWWVDIHISCVYSTYTCTTYTLFATHTHIYDAHRTIDFEDTPHSTLSFMCTCHMWWIDIHISCIYNTYTYLQHTSYDRFWIHTPFHTLVYVYMPHVMDRYTHIMYLQHVHIFTTHVVR